MINLNDNAKLNLARQSSCCSLEFEQYNSDSFLVDISIDKYHDIQIYTSLSSLDISEKTFISVTLEKGRPFYHIYIFKIYPGKDNGVQEIIPYTRSSGFGKEKTKTITPEIKEKAANLIGRVIKLYKAGISND